MKGGVQMTKQSVKKKRKMLSVDIVDSITELDTTSLLKKAKEKYSDRYSSQMVQLIEDNMRLERALKHVRRHIQRVADGDVLAIEDYMDSRKKLENE